MLLVLLLAGCRTYWERDGASTEDFYRDQGQCQAQAGMTPVPVNGGMVYESCMRGKGWHKVRKQQ